MSVPRADPEASPHSPTQSQGHTYGGPSCANSTIVTTGTLQEREREEGGSPITSPEHWPVPFVPGEPPTRAQGHPKGQEYLQQCQGVQGDLSHQADLGDPKNKTKGGRVRWRHPLPQPAPILHPTPPYWSAPYWHTHHLARSSIFTRSAGLSLGTERTE